jgi:hypothetical protein
LEDIKKVVSFENIRKEIHMKSTNIILILFPVLAIGALWYYASIANQKPDQIINKEQKPLSYEDNSVQCPQCNMFLVGKKDTAQIITNDHKTHFFDDVGCAILWLEEQNIEPKSIKFWVYTRDTKKYVLAIDAFYSKIDDTPMKYGFSAYENSQEDFIGFEDMRLKMLRGEHLHDPKIRKNLLGR